VSKNGRDFRVFERDLKLWRRKAIVAIGIPKLGSVLVLGWVKRSLRERAVFNRLSADERFTAQHLGLGRRDFGLAPDAKGQTRVSSSKESPEPGV
jgi:hypothetical protein